MSNPLLMHIYFKSKVAELLNRYKTESLEKDTQNGMMRNLNWSLYKRDTLIPLFLKTCNSKALENAASAAEYNDEFRSLLHSYLENSDCLRNEYNRINKTNLERGDLEIEYIEGRILNMIDHLTALYGIYNLESTREKNIIGAGNKNAFDRNIQVQQLFAMLYDKPRMGKEEYESIDDLVKFLDEFQDVFETEFEQTIVPMRDNNGDMADNEKRIQDFKEKQYDLELAKALKTYNKTKYDAAVSKSQTTTSAYVGYAVSTTWSLARWLTYDASSALYNAAANIGESLIDRWVKTEGPQSATISAATATSSPYRPGASTRTIVDDTDRHSTDSQHNRVSL